METTIKKIAIRRGMKGEQVGKAVIESFVHDYLYREEEGYRPLYAPEELQRMLMGLQNQYERRIYTEYISLYNGIVAEFNRAQGAFQQAQSGFYMLYISLKNVLQSLRAKMWLLEFADDYGIDQYTEEFRRRNEEYSALFVSIFALYENDTERREIEHAREKFLYPALRSMHAYNSLMTQVRMNFSLDSLSHIQMDIDYLTDQFDQYNIMREQTRRLYMIASKDTVAMLDEMFPPLDALHGITTDRAEKSVREKLQNPENYEGGGLQRLLLELIEG